ncbi:hypothetical protein M422DRAFT_55086 [Sphaerobolus stellatus SS14]|uniref:Uncharacterized protein n=1 Tax=Sphaerobolus stellatus (strain SS14) TaxID=990650 RepID=A0A0C9UEG8_SPHS4|nr:hypothetical protein M422DRAFT_55086 [Sphaerobolus stellatus SS14]
MASLAKFVSVAVSRSGGDTEANPLWYMANVFPSEAEFHSFTSLIRPSFSEKMGKGYTEMQWAPIDSSREDFIGEFQPVVYSAFSNSGYSINELSDIGNLVTALRNDEDGTQLDSRAEKVARLAKTLNPIMVSTWLDVAPTLFGITASSSKFETEAKLAQVTMETAICLYGAIFRERDLSNDIRSQAVDDINALLGYMSPYLPRSSESGDPELEDFTRALSLSYCELTSMTALASQCDIKNASKSRATLKLKQFKALSTQLSRVREYVAEALNGELKSVSHPMGYSLTSTAYAALLPTIWSLVNFQSDNGDSDLSTNIRMACIKHATRTSSKSAVKRPATLFVGMLLMLYGFRGSPLGRQKILMSEEIDAFREWYQQLPKVLWELGVSDPSLTEVVLSQFLLNFIVIGVSRLFCGYYYESASEARRYWILV